MSHADDTGDSLRSRLAAIGTAALLDDLRRIARDESHALPQAGDLGVGRVAVGRHVEGLQGSAGRAVEDRAPDVDVKRVERTHQPDAEVHAAGHRGEAGWDLNEIPLN